MTPRKMRVRSSAAARCRQSIRWLCLLFLACPALGWSETPPPRPAPSLEEIKQLVRQLGDEQFEVRENASSRLQEAGVAALSMLENATESPDPEIRTRAWRIIDQLAGDGQIPALLFQLACNSPPVRAVAAESLGKMEGKAQNALPSLIKATGDQTEFVRCSAQEAVKKIQATLPVKLEVKHNVESIEIDGETFYRIEVTNQGKEAATNVSIQALVPDQLTVQSVQGPVKHRQDGQRIAIESFTLEANDSRFCEVHVKAQRAGTARLKIEVQVDGLIAPLLGEAATTVTAPNPTPEQPGK